MLNIVAKSLQWLLKWLTEMIGTNVEKTLGSVGRVATSKKVAKKNLEIPPVFHQNCSQESCEILMLR